MLVRDLLPELHAALLASDSATEVLERFFGPPVLAVRIACVPIEPSQKQFLRLRLSASDRWTHRRVMLTSQGRTVSHADLWYVPHRLERAMVDALETTDRPFGHVVRPLRPIRSTLFAHLPAPGEKRNLEHRALLTIRTEAGLLPIAEVHERYGSGLPVGS